MYLSDKDIKALKVILENNNKVRPTSRKARAIRQLNHSLNKNQSRIRQQRKMVNNMFDVPTTKKNNNPFD